MKILIIEDDTFFQKFYATKFAEKNFTVETAGNGVEGLEKMKQTNPDVVLLDIVMPQMDGFEVLTNVSKDEALKKIPILVFSTLAQEKDVERAKQLGAKGYVNKSFYDFENLFNSVVSYIAK